MYTEFRRFVKSGPIVTEQPEGSLVRAFILDPEEQEPKEKELRLNKAHDPRVIADFSELVPFGTTHDAALEETKMRAVDWLDYNYARLGEPNPENTRIAPTIDEQDPLQALMERGSEDDEIIYCSPPIMDRNRKEEVVTHLIIPSYGPSYACR